MEKLVKPFTRDLSLSLIQWWTKIQKENYEKALGVGYHDNPVVSNGLVAECFFFERDLTAIKKAFAEKLAKDEDLYLRQRNVFLQTVREARQVRKEAVKELDSKHIGLYKNLLSRLFPMYRYANILPALWADDLRKELGREKAEKTIKAAFEDRIEAEGAVEDIEAALRTACEKNLKKIGKPPKWAKFLSQEDVEKLVSGGEINWNEVEARSRGYVYCRKKIYANEKYAEVFKKNNYYYEEEKAGGILKGSVAFDGGVIEGVVRKVFVPGTDFKKGEILVMIMTGPDFVDLMKKAGAVVTDEGGITCHASIVSRELKVPCVVGTRFATKVLKDGDKVKVDTKTGIVEKI